LEATVIRSQLAVVALVALLAGCHQGEAPPAVPGTSTLNTSSTATSPLEGLEQDLRAQKDLEKSNIRHNVHRHERVPSEGS
jgi:hypothetical protein